MGQGNAASIALLHLDHTGPRVTRGWGQEMSSLPGTPLPPALPCLMGTVGVPLPNVPMPAPSPAGGYQYPKRTGIVAAVLGALPACGNFASHPLKPHSHCAPIHAKHGRLYYILLYFSFQNKQSLGVSALQAPSQQKASPLFLPSRESHWCCMVPWQWLALLPTRMLPGSNPSLPAAPKGSKMSRVAIHLLAAD